MSRVTGVDPGLLVPRDSVREQIANFFPEARLLSINPACRSLGSSLALAEPSDDRLGEKPIFGYVAAYVISAMLSVRRQPTGEVPSPQVMRANQIGRYYGSHN